MSRTSTSSPCSCPSFGSSGSFSMNPSVPFAPTASSSKKWCRLRYESFSASRGCSTDTSVCAKRSRYVACGSVWAAGAQTEVSVLHICPMNDFNVYEVLNRKRRGAPMESREIEQFIDLYTRGDIPDYQMSALLMAVAINGMTTAEMATLTQSMLRSGEQWRLRDEYDFIADKHSTGGVGDKVSLVLSPWVAACGIRIGMLSGRGLGHTGGTLDKLEAIPGFNARLSRA